MQNIFIILLFSQFISFSYAAPAFKKEWTILVYLNGDNNLTRFIQSSLKRIERAGSSANVNVLVQFDGDKERDSKRMYIQKNLLNSAENIVFEENVEYDMGEPATMASFIEWGVRNFPSEKLAIFVNSHGRGILNLPTDDGSFNKKATTTLASSPDSSSGTYILEEFMVREVEKVLARYRKNKKIDLFIYGACLMGNFEVLSTLTSIARYVVASEYPIYIKGYDGLEENDLGIGVSIEDLLNYIAKRDATSSIEAASIILDTFRASYEDYKIEEVENVYVGPDSTLALYDLSFVEKIEESLQKIVARFISNVTRDESLIDDFYIKLLSVKKPHQLGYLDMGDFLGFLYEDFNIAEAKELKNFINDKFVMNSVLLNVPESNLGLSIFFPQDIINNSIKLHEGLMDFYSTLRVSKKSNLDRAIMAYLNVLKERKLDLLFSLSKNYLLYDIDHGIRLYKEELLNTYYLFQELEKNIREKLKANAFPLYRIKAYYNEILKSKYKSIYFSKHKKNIKKLIENNN